MIRRVSVLDVEGSDFSPAVPFLGPCKFYTVFVNLGLFAINAIILHEQTAHFLFSVHLCCKDFLWWHRGQYVF